MLRFSSIGDIVLATSPLATLRRTFPSARIDFITLTRYSPLLEGHRDLDRLLALSAQAGFSALEDLGRHLRRSGYDLVVDLHNSLRSRIIGRHLRGTKKLVLKKPRWKRFLLFQFHRNRFPPYFSQRRLLHEPLAEYLGPDYQPPLTRLYLTSLERQQARDRLDGAGVGDDYLVVIPAAAWGQKSWLPARYREVLQEVGGAGGLDLVVLGGAGDEICARIIPPGVNGVDLHGQTDLRESLGIISRARLVLGSDTGFLHAAEALGVPALMLLGPTSMETGAGTYRSRSATLAVPDLWCRPCSQNGSRPCYRSEPFCLTGLTVDEVTSQISSLLGVA